MTRVFGKFFEDFFDLILLNKFIFVLFLLIIIYHIIFFLIRDLGYIKQVKQHKDPEKVNKLDFNNFPLVYIIIPAWKEGKAFKNCLLSIKKLKYPNLKIIINAGGNKETIKIASQYKQEKNYIILEQKGGKRKAALGKIKAINEALNYVSEGVIYIIDADCSLTEEILLRNIEPLINKDEDIVMCGTRPLKSQEHNDLARYLEFKRLDFAIIRYKRYQLTRIGGASTSLKYGVIRKIEKFNENRIIPTEWSMGKDVIENGFKVYYLNHYNSNIYTEYPESFKELYYQRFRYIENNIINAYKNQKILPFIKVLFSFLISFYFIIFPFLFFINSSLIFYGLFILLSHYLKRIRLFMFFKLVYEKKLYTSFNKILFMKMIFYITFEIYTYFTVILLIFKNLRKTLKGF